MKKNILVTGSEGFIGSHLVERLVSEGYSVKALVFYNSFGSIGWLNDLDKNILENVEVIFGDIRDFGQMNQAIRNSDVVINLAALISIPYSYAAPRSYIDTNVYGTLNILQAALDNDVSVLHTSTSEVYGTAQYVPMDENHRVIGQSPYSASKVAADQLAISFHSSFGLPAKIIRPFNTYGPRQSSRAVIPNIIMQILSGKTELELGSLVPTRDFNFVEDTVGGFVQALESENGYGEAINIGSGFEISIGDTVDLIGKLLNVDITIKQSSSRLRPTTSEVFRLCASNEKALKMWGWAPKYNGEKGLRQGLLKTIDWYRDKRNIASVNTLYRFV